MKLIATLIATLGFSVFCLPAFAETCPTGASAKAAFDAAYDDMVDRGMNVDNATRTAMARKTWANGILVWQSGGRAAIAADGGLSYGIAKCYGGTCGMTADSTISTGMYDFINKKRTDLPSGVPNAPPQSAVEWARNILGCGDAAAPAPATQQIDSQVPSGLSEQEKLGKLFEFINGNDQSKAVSAIQEVKAMCTSGYGQACSEMGNLSRLHPGNDPVGANARALEYYDRGCSAGDGFGCAAAGDMQMGDKDPVDVPASALVYFEKACELDSAAGCSFAGIAQRKGAGGPVDLVAARAAFEKGCTLEDNVSCFYTGLYRVKGEGGPQDLMGAIEPYKFACDKDIVGGCNNLGLLYWKTFASPETILKARPLFEKACQLGSDIGCDNLGKMQSHGIGGPVDRAAAIESFTKGCKMDHAWSCTDLGVEYYQASDIAANEMKARVSFTKACRLDHGPACYTVYTMNRDGEGGPVDQAAASAALEKSCTLGYENACAHMNAAP
jgi:TPR repeat protein